MQVIIRCFVLIGLFACGYQAALADTVSAKGMASVQLSGKLTAELKGSVLRDAKINALDRYISEANQAKAANYGLARATIVGDIDAYILSATILSETVDSKPLAEIKKPKKGNYQVVVRADIDANRLNNELKSHSAVANTSSYEKSLLTFVFVARQQKSVKSYDDKVYKRSEAQGSEQSESGANRQSSESERISGSTVALDDTVAESSSSKKNSVSTTTTGGSKTAKANIVEWDVAPASEVTSVMTGIFSSAGFEVVEAEYLEEESGGLVSVEAIRNDYSTGDDLASATLRNTAKGIRSVEIPYFALGTLDVGMRSTDPSSGLVRIYVTVSGKVLDVSGRFPKTVSAVGPIQVAGLGPDESVARVNGLKLAAEAAAKQMADELNAKGVR
jgi:hypothetical protein